MAAYAIASITIHNTDWQKEYGEKMPALIQKHSGKVLARTPAKELEGQSLLPGAVVMIEFPTQDHALAWNADPDHEHLRQLRSSGSDFHLMLVNGL